MKDDEEMFQPVNPQPAQDQDPHNPTPAQMLTILETWGSAPTSDINKALSWALPILRAHLEQTEPAGESSNPLPKDPTILQTRWRYYGEVETGEANQTPDESEKILKEWQCNRPPSTYVLMRLKLAISWALETIDSLALAVQLKAARGANSNLLTTIRAVRELVDAEVGESTTAAVRRALTPSSPQKPDVLPIVLKMLEDWQEMEGGETMRADISEGARERAAERADLLMRIQSVMHALSGRLVATSNS